MPRCCFASSRIARTRASANSPSASRSPPCSSAPSSSRNSPTSAPTGCGAPITARWPLTWIAALAISALLRARREDREVGVVFAIGSVYGNIVMLGIPLVLSALGNEAAGPMALILSVNTPLLWLCGILQMELVSRKRTGSPLSVIRPVLADLARNPLMLAIGFGVVWRLAGLGLTPVVDRTIELLAQAGSPTALIALGINLFRFEVKGEKLSILVMCALKLAAMPAAAFVLARLLDLPPIAAGVVVLFAAMPTGANAYIFAVQYQRLVNPVSGAVALGTLLAAMTLPVVVVWVVAGGT
ncbi:AEC family transporter [Bradyrhizobium sp. RDT46]|uniref:AEC family transporter n=1 Tax=Bradyrhizobium sp. RDT46 TaxID=3341829 RepID=UPI0035C6B612